MPVRTDPWPAGTPCWVDVAVPDQAAAREFYSAVLGWTFEDTGAEFGNYLMCRRDGRAVAGIGSVQDPNQPSAWTTYLASDAVDTTAKEIGARGGMVVAGPFEIPGSGRMCVGIDPQGAAFGVWQAAAHVGAELYNEPGALVWNEALVADPDAGRAFYGDIFGHTYEPLEGAATGDYTTIHLGGPPVGGIGPVSGGLTGWQTYFQVADADAVVAAARQAGATVPREPEDTPFGRIAVITDPQGATFGLIGA